MLVYMRDCKQMEKVECPICGRLFGKSVISAHADRCLDETDVDDEEVTSDVNLSWDSKRPRIEEGADVTPSCSSPVLCDLTSQYISTQQMPWSAMPVTDCAGSSRTSVQSTKSTEVCLSTNQSWTRNVQSASACASARQAVKRSTKSASLLGYFTGGQKSVQPKEGESGRGSGKGTPATLQSDGKLVKQAISSENMSDTELCNVNTVRESKRADILISSNSTVNRSATAQSSVISAFVPLAERMRPTMLVDFVGQGHIVGSRRPLRSLLESTVISSMILWGPPGCGKVLHLVACVCISFSHHVCVLTLAS